MIDLEPFQKVMNQNILKLVGLGAIIIAGSLFFKKLEKRLKSKRRRR